MDPTIETYLAATPRLTPESETRLLDNAVLALCSQPTAEVMLAVRQLGMARPTNFEAARSALRRRLWAMRLHRIGGAAVKGEVA